MQRKSKNILTKLIIVLFICSAVFYIALHVRIENNFENDDHDGNGSEIGTEDPIIIPDPIDPPVDEDYVSVGYNLAEFLCKDIYINGWHINNWQLSKPFVTINDEIFVPMTKAVMDALGLEINFNDEKHWVRFSRKEPSLAAVYEGECPSNLKYTEVFWGHKYYFGQQEAPDNYAATDKEDRTLYLSLNALRIYSGLDMSWYYDQVGGIYISTIVSVPAKDFFSENNKGYIEGRARYMMSVNPDLPYETALYYEYLFRHEGTVYTYCSQDMLMGICQTESRFVHTAESHVQAIGLMQVLLEYAEDAGYTLEMIQQPHYNIQRGASWLEMFIEYCDCDPELGLAAYYLGPGNLYSQIEATGTYDSNYADVCNYNKYMLQSYVSSLGYSNSFEEYTGKQHIAD